MPDTPFTIDTKMNDLPKSDWLAAIAEVAEEDGFFQRLSRKHHAIFVERSSTLLVSFETISGMRSLSSYSHPLGWEMVRNYGWSNLCIASNGDTWFRDPAVYACFDRLIDDGFFDEFDKVIFYGTGPCGYAAAAYSVSAPGARVVAIQPQATLDPRMTEWDDRFKDMRRTDFTSRFGYAPDMLDAADAAFVLYDPKVDLDAMHASLFTRPNVTKLRMRHMGAALQSDLLQMDQLENLLCLAADGELDTQSFARLYRARRDYINYLRSLLSALETDKRTGLVLRLCHFVNGRMQVRRFLRRQRQIEAEMNPPEDAEDEATQPATQEDARDGAPAQSRADTAAEAPEEIHADTPAEAVENPLKKAAP